MSPLCGSKLNVHPGFLNVTSVTVIFWIPALFGIKFWTDDKYLELNFDLQQPGGREKPSSDEWLEWTLNLWVWISSIFKPRNVSSASSVKSTCHPQPLSWYPNICRQTAGTAAGPPGTQPWRLLRGSFCQLFLALFLTSKTHSKSTASTKEPLLFLFSSQGFQSYWSYLLLTLPALLKQGGNVALLLQGQLWFLGLSEHETTSVYTFFSVLETLSLLSKQTQIRYLEILCTKTKGTKKKMQHMKCLCMEAENAQEISAKQGISLLWNRTTEPYGAIPREGMGICHTSVVHFRNSLMLGGMQSGRFRTSPCAPPFPEL